jgi:hypothetical protein
VKSAASDGVTAVVHAAGDPAELGQLLRPGGRLASLVGATVEQVGRDDVTVIPVLAVDTVEKMRDLVDKVAAGDLESQSHRRSRSRTLRLRSTRSGRPSSASSLSLFPDPDQRAC